MKLAAWSSFLAPAFSRRTRAEKNPLVRRLILLGLLAYLAFLVLYFPAERAYAYWQKMAEPSASISLSGISGSVWSGRADVAMIAGQRVDALSWGFRPWALLSGQLALSWAMQLADGYGRGIVAAGLDGRIHLQQLDARLPLALIPVKALRALKPSGILNLGLARMTWDGKSFTETQGRVVWNTAGIHFLQAFEWGDLAIDIETVGDEVRGVISDAGGPLQIDGLIVISAAGDYQFSASLGARADAPATLAKALRALGNPGVDGKIKLNQSGTLAALGLSG